MEVIDSFGDQTLKPEYDPWDIVDVHGREHSIQEMFRSIEAVRVASDVESSSLSSVAQSPGKLTVQRRTPAQGPKLIWLREAERCLDKSGEHITFSGKNWQRAFVKNDSLFCIQLILFCNF